MGRWVKQPRIAVAAAIVVAALTAGCSSSSPTATSAPATAASGALEFSSQNTQVIDRIEAPVGWTISLWASGRGKWSNPDAIDIDGQDIWVGYQNASVKDGSNNAKNSTVVEYTMTGSVVKSWNVTGHVDGVRVEPATHKVWVTSNEDAAPLLNIIDPSTAAPTPITLAPTVHGGGYDDVWFINGTAFVACSNPNLDANGNNIYPAIDTLTVSGTSATVSPVLMGNASATDAVAGTSTTLNLTDPDSLTIDNKGNLVLISQGDSVIIQIANPGAANQTVTKTPIGNQMDDTVWATAKSGRLFVVDAGKNSIYVIKWSGPKGTVISEAPNDSGVVGFIGTIDMTTGFINPVSIGWIKPTGLIFVPGS